MGRGVHRKTFLMNLFLVFGAKKITDDKLIFVVSDLLSHKALSRTLFHYLTVSIKKKFRVKMTKMAYTILRDFERDE